MRVVEADAFLGHTGFILFVFSLKRCGAELSTFGEKWRFCLVGMQISGRRDKEKVVRV